MLSLRVSTFVLLLAGALAFVGGAGVYAQPAPPKPTPVKFTPPKITRNMSPEQQKYYDEHPDEMHKAVAEEKRLKQAVAEHDAATRKYRAYVQRKETDARRQEIVARVQNQAPKFDPAASRKSPASEAGMSTVTKVLIGLLVPVLAVFLVRRRLQSD